MKKILFIADFFADEILGGGELCSEEIITFLRKKEYRVEEVKSQNVSKEKLQEYSENSVIFVSNFVGLSSVCKAELRNSEKQYKYFIIEHDHKYCESRNPMSYVDMIVPEDKIRNEDFFNKASAVLCQSRSHSHLVQKNLWNSKIINLGTNLWSDDTLNMLEGLIDNKKTVKYASMNTANPIKGTKQTIELCRNKNLDCKFIDFKDQKSFFSELSKVENFIFLPQSPETYSRVAIEAKILGCNLVTNKAIGVMSEDYYEQSGKQLLETIRSNKKKVLNTVLDLVEDRDVEFVSHINKPKVCLITTTYKGSKYIKNFLDNFVAQTYNGPKELIIVDANSPENENEICAEYKEKYDNIRYIKLADKKTTMECFNIATDLTDADYVGLCMIDDVVAPWYIDKLSKHLFLDEKIDLVYGDTYETTKENETISNNSSDGKLFQMSTIPFSKEGMIKNIPGCMPMYRRNLHYKIGGYKTDILHGGDWEFYLNAIRNNARFKKVDTVVGMYYNNPSGLSTSTDLSVSSERRKSERKIFEEYRDVFGEKVYSQFKSYFDQFV